MKRTVAKKYLKIGGENKDLLKKIIEMGLPKKMEDLAMEKFLKIATKDDLIEILPLTNDERVATFLLKEKLNLEDECSLIMGCNEEIAEKFFEKMKKEAKIEDLTEEDLKELNLSDNEKIRKWAAEKLMEKLMMKKEELEDEMKLEENPIEKEGILWDIIELEQEIEKLKKELGKTKPLQKEEELALASNFFYFYNGVTYGFEIFPFALPL